MDEMLSLYDTDLQLSNASRAAAYSKSTRVIMLLDQLKSGNSFQFKENCTNLLGLLSSYIQQRLQKY